MDIERALGARYTKVVLSSEGDYMCVYLRGSIVQLCLQESGHWGIYLLVSMCKRWALKGMHINVYKREK